MASELLPSIPLELSVRVLDLSRLQEHLELTVSPSQISGGRCSIRTL